MKYGEQFEKESVPQWSLYNIDYNSLKHHIKAHTTKDQATAIAIPGSQDSALGKFENDLFLELCAQHDRVDLFVSSKADEIARRLQHLSSQIHRLILRCATSGRERMPLKRQQRFAKYEQQLLQCGDDIRALQRFVNAQIVAFRKILKKYRKWTGSSTLGSRFRDNVLSHSKSFTRRDFAPLQSQYNDLLETLHAALPADTGGRASPSADSRHSRPPSAQLSPSETLVHPEPQPVHVGYWNEYDCGSEAGDLDRDADEYAIYIDPNEDLGFPGMKTLGAFLTKPVHKLNAWISFRHKHSDSDDNNDEHGPLLPTHTTTGYGYGSTRSPPSLTYFSTPPGGTVSSQVPTLDTDAEDDYLGGNSRPGSHAGAGGGGYASSSDGDHSSASLLFPSGYYAHHSAACLPSVADQRVARYRERVLAVATWVCFAVAWVLMGVVGALVVVGASGRHNRNSGRVRLEVDAGVVLGIVTSLGLACGGLGMACSRRDRLGVWEGLVVGAGFVGACGVNGVLLVLVMGHSRM